MRPDPSTLPAFRVGTMASGRWILLFAAFSPFCRAGDIPRPPTMGARSAVYAPHGIAATSQPLATNAAISVLEQGGNAVDAAVTAAAVLSVTEPLMTGIGGDMFALVWSAKDHRLYALNASGRSGSLMTLQELRRRGHTEMPYFGPETITVPGALGGWQALETRFGRRSLAEALQPAIDYAENGFPVSPIIAQGWTADQGPIEKWGSDPGFKAAFLNGGKGGPAAGDWFRNPDYARTLRLIAAKGPDAFYKGEIARKIVDSLLPRGGFLTVDDFARNEPIWVTPISVLFHGYRVWELPPNNMGIAALEMLRIVEPYDLKTMGHNSAAYLHLMIEAKKLAYADLEKYDGDADHLTMTPDYLLSDAYIARRRAQIDPAHAKRQVEPGPARTKSDTVYLTVADAEGNMVSFINSNSNIWGSRVVVPGLGFVLHNRAGAFSLVEGLPNTAGPGKRPSHTLIPAFVTRPGPQSDPNGHGDEPFMSFGLMGGGMQPQGHAQFLINYLVFGMGLQESVDAGRFRHNQGEQVLVEGAITDPVIAELNRLGHEVSLSTGANFGGAQAIVKLAHGYEAASDPRKDGQASGY